MVDMVVENASAVRKLDTELYTLHSQGAEAVSILLVFYRRAVLVCLN